LSRILIVVNIFGFLGDEGAKRQCYKGVLGRHDLKSTFDVKIICIQYARLL
jgi:hypothetical protein